MSSFITSLPEYNFVETDPAKMRQLVFAAYEGITKRTLSPGQPERLFCEVMTYLLTHERVNLNLVARSQLLAYATGDLLDHIGAKVYCRRLQSSPARTTLHVTLATPAAYDWIMPVGARVTGDNKIYFATESLLVIPAGTNSGAVPLACTSPGAAGNGYAPGQLNRLVDPLPYVADVRNATASSGGADVEDDDRYRERIHLAPAQWSSAGPEDAYRYWAMTAHQDIADVAVHSPRPCEVDLHVLLTGGRIPDEAMLDLVRQIFTRRERVPLTDKITVRAPAPTPYTASLTWWMHKEDAIRAGIIRANVDAAVASWAAWQSARIGRDHNPSELIRLVMQAGAKRVAVASPPHTKLEQWEIAVPEDAPAITFGGVEEA